MSNLKGDYVVAGMVTGTHVIEDIGIPVPHQVAVRIPANLAHRSKDLWRGLQQKRLFLLTGGTFVDSGVEAQQVVAVPVADDTESCRLRKELEAAKKENEALRGVLGVLQAQDDKLEAILTVLGQLSTNPQAVVAPVSVAKVENDVVGGEVPMYIPSDGLKPKDAEANLQVVENTLEGDSVKDAAQKLKKLRSRML